LLGPSLARWGGIWWWALTGILAIGVFKTVSGLVAMRILFELVNGSPGGRGKQAMIRAMLDVAARRPHGEAQLAEWGVRLPPRDRATSAAAEPGPKL
jgi:hypothetical protein